MPQTVGLLMGPLDYAMMVHAPTLARRLSSSTTSVTVPLGDDAGECFLRAARGPHRITMPAPAREQLLIEGFTVETWGALIEWFLDDTAPRGPGSHSVAVGFSDDARLWDPARR